MTRAEGRRFALTQLRLKLAAVPSQEAIYEEALAALPEQLRDQVQHASGGLPDVRGTSDVDISHHTAQPHDLLAQLPEGTTAERRDDQHSIYSLPGYDRPVNLYATSDPDRAQRAVRHRATELALAQAYPALTEQARQTKAEGLGTEKAWAKALGVANEDPYEAMLDKERMLALAKALQKTSAADLRYTKPTGQLTPIPTPLDKIAKAHKLSRRMEFRGLKISIETDKGEKRHWYDAHNDTKGTTTMKYPYGYIRRTEGLDGDHVDVYVGPNEEAKKVYVVHQQKAPNFNSYDEDKCMLGFESADAAKKAYLDHYNDRRFFGSMTVMPFEQFKRKVMATFKRPQKIAATSLRFIQQLERDFGKDFARRFFDETTRSAKGLSRSRPMTAEIQRGLVRKTQLPPPIPKMAYYLGVAQARAVLFKHAQNLGDPMFWQGGQEEMPPEGMAQQGGTAEDAALALPPGIFQGLQMKVNPDGQRSTTVKVTPEALGAPDALAGIFQAEPEAKVEMSMPQASGEGAGGAGGGGGPSDMGVPEGAPVDGAGAMPVPAVPPKVAEYHRLWRG